jgi:chromate transporter
MGAGAAVAPVAVGVGLGVAVPIWRRAAHERTRVLAYALAGGVAAATTGPWLVLVLLTCGAIELGFRGLARGSVRLHAWPVLAVLSDPGGTGALVWTAFKVGALAFGGGFVIVPLMQTDAVSTYHWMTHAQFLNAVALGLRQQLVLSSVLAVCGLCAPALLVCGLLCFGAAGDGDLGALVECGAVLRDEFCRHH